MQTSLLTHHLITQGLFSPHVLLIKTRSSVSTTRFLLVLQQQLQMLLKLAKFVMLVLLFGTVVLHIMAAVAFAHEGLNN